MMPVGQVQSMRIRGHPLIGIAYVGFEFGAADVYLDGFGDALFVGSEEVEALLVDVVDALELCPLIDRPRERADLYLEFVFEFVE